MANPQAKELPVTARIAAAVGARGLPVSAWLQLAALTLFGLALRLINLGRQGLWFDEAYSIFIAKLELAFSFDVLIADGVHPPGYYLLQRVALLLGESEAAVRLPAMLFGLLAIPLMFLIGNQWAGERTGLIAAALMALSPFSIWYSQEARMYSALMTLSIVCMLAYGRLLQPGRHHWAEVVFVLASGLAYLTHYFALFLPLVQFVHIAIHFKQLHGLLRRWIVLQLLAVVPLLIWLFFIYQQPEVIVGIGWIKDSRVIDIWYTLMNFTVGFVGGADVLRWLTTILFLVLAIMGARTIWRIEVASSLLILWALLPPLITLLMSIRRPMYVDRFLILSLPAVLLLAARGLDGMSRRIRLVAGSAVLLLSLYGIATFVYGPEQLKEDWRGAVEHLGAAESDEALVVRTLQMVIPLAYYHEDYKAFDVIEVNREVAPISEIAKGHRGMWLLYWSPAADAHSVAALHMPSLEDETNPQIAQWITGQGPPILDRLDLRGLTIYHFDDIAAES